MARFVCKTFFAASLCISLSACPEPPKEPVGASDKSRVMPKPPAPPKTTNAPPGDLRSGLVVLPGKSPSMGHASGRWDYSLSVNEDGRAILEGKVREAKVGAKLVMDHFERATGEKGPTMAMEKREKGFDPEHGDWRWIVVGTSGNLVFDGKTERCWGCHEDAPNDHDRVFPRHD